MNIQLITRSLRYIMLLSACALSASAAAHSLQVIADYPLTDNLFDITGLNDDVFLEGNPTPPVEPSPGVELCQNGIYLLNTDGQNIQTPVLNSFDLQNFEMELEFKLEALPDPGNPFGYSGVIMGGKFSRWIGISVDLDGRMGLKYNNDVGNVIWSSAFIAVDNQFHSGRIRYNFGSTQFYIEDNLLLDVDLPPLFPFMDDFEFTTTDFNTGRPFTGCIRNLIVRSPPLAIFASGFE